MIMFLVIIVFSSVFRFVCFVLHVILALRVDVRSAGFPRALFLFFVSWLLLVPRSRYLVGEHLISTDQTVNGVAVGVLVLGHRAEARAPLVYDPLLVQQQVPRDLRLTARDFAFKGCDRFSILVRKTGQKCTFFGVMLVE
jgi:hypothetical protein